MMSTLPLTEESPNCLLMILTFFYFIRTLTHCLKSHNLNLLADWLLANKLSLSIGQNKDTKYSLFCPGKKPSIESLPKLEIFRTEVPNTSCVKYLGVMLDENLKFKEHVQKLCNKVKKYVNIIYKIRCRLPKTWLRNLYFTFVFNNIYYCAEIYGNTNKTILSPLQIVQNQSLRALQFKTKYEPVNEMHKSFKILKVQDIVDYKLNKLIHSLIHNPATVPEALHGLILKTENVHHHGTRNKKYVYHLCGKRACVLASSEMPAFTKLEPFATNVTHCL